MKQKPALIAGIVVAVALLGYGVYDTQIRRSPCLSAFLANPTVQMESSDYECVREAISQKQTPETDKAILSAVLQRLEETREVQLLMLVKDKWRETEGKRFSDITSAIENMAIERRANYADALMEICDYHSAPYDRIRAGEIMRTGDGYKNLAVAVMSVSMLELYAHRDDVEYMMMRKDVPEMTHDQRVALKLGILRRIDSRMGLGKWFGQDTAYLKQLVESEPALRADVLELLKNSNLTLLVSPAAQ